MPLNPLHSLRDLLQLPRPRLHYRVDGIEAPPSGRWSASALIVSRGLCRFGRFDLGRVPAAKRSAALALQLAEWSPFADADHAVLWTPAGRALVWCWDASALKAAWPATARQGQPPAQPESAFWAPPPAGVRVRLVQTLDGYEAQAWQDGELVHSRWWRQLPPPPEAQLFLRDAGLSATDAGDWLRPQTLPLGRQAWLPMSRAGQSASSTGLLEPAIYAACLISVLAPAAALAVDHWRLSQAQTQVNAALERESQRSEAIIAARTAAMAAADEARALIALQAHPSPLLPMAAIAAELPASSPSTLREWEMADGKLRMLFQSTAGDLSGAEHVQALERTRLFDDVKIITQVDPKFMAFQMNLRKTPLDAMSVPTAASAPR